MITSNGLQKKHIKSKGEAISEIVLKQKFWDDVQQVVDLCAPLVTVLRMCDGAVPSTGKLYWKIFSADLEIQNSKLPATKKQNIRQLISNRWKMLHTDLHSAGFVLDPEYQTYQQHENEEVMTGFHNIVEKIYKDDVQAQVWLMYLYLKKVLLLS